MPLITLTTDFGHDSPYVAAMKGVIASINPAATVVDLTHSVPPQDILTGALVLGDTARWFPGGTIHLGVVDPGVGTERKIVCLTGGDHFFVGPDNGLFTTTIAEGPAAVAHEVANPVLHCCSLRKEIASLSSSSAMTRGSPAGCTVTAPSS